ncbi:DUF6318 family protein [Rothia mucilaginosa]|uniref:DUF6318 family protein n=1 Tax=Rothia mucilaginosa TaxID=43675 RepID=UPI0028D1AFD4|nr:DUF6318 family protein [Rothia mucilaginosa]
MSFRPSAHTSFSANDRNGLTRRTVLFGGLTAGALALAGCAFNKDIRPTGSGDTFSGSPSASASPSASVSASPSESASASASASSSSSSSRSSAKIIPSDEFLKDYKKYIGDVKYEYKPAIAHYVEPTDTSPAKNVPIPVIDTVAQRTVSLEGAYKTLAAYQSAYIAAMYNGDLQYLKGLVHGADSGLVNNLKAIAKLYAAGGWTKDYESKLSIRDDLDAKALASSDLAVVAFPCRDVVKEYTIYQKGTGEPQKASTLDVVIYVVYAEGKWRVTSREYFVSEYSDRFRKVFEGPSSSASASKSSGGGSGSSGGSSSGSSSDFKV